ncbi:hypothetical protein ANTPLA_LOCUS5433 [Anthophora plagiata]
MRNWLIIVPRLDTVFFVIFVVQVTTTLSKHVESDRYNSIQNIPDEWRYVPSGYQPPKIEVRLMKSQAPKSYKNWVHSVEYVLSSNNQETVINGNTGNEVEETDRKKNIKNKPHLGSRTVIRVPWLGCPSGQKRDYRGKCRDVVDLH